MPRRRLGSEAILALVASLSVYTTLISSANVAGRSSPATKAATSAQQNVPAEDTKPELRN